jgi:hypothetical protein
MHTLCENTATSSQQGPGKKERFMSSAIRTFAEFWPYYVRQHSKRRTRLLHAAGSVLAIVALALGLAISPWFFLAALVVGYSFAWFGHFFVERNRPASFQYPLYSLAADYRMLFLMMAGRMREEALKYGAEP